MAIYSFRKITIIKHNKPERKNLNQDLQWFSNSLGLFGERDKERSCFRIFIEIVKGARRKIHYTSDELALKTNLTRGTVVHHLNKLIEKGLIIFNNGRYILRVNNLEDLTKEIRKEMNTVLEELQSMAKELDKELGLERKDSRSDSISD
jgi:DNA-binding MarR family transcriptional regulator